MTAEFTLDERPDAWVLTVTGEIDYADGPELRSYVESIVSAAPPSAIVDLSEVRYLDSSSLGLLLKLHREYDADSKRLTIVTSASVLAVLGLTRLTGCFRTVPDLAAAEASLGA